MNQRLIALEREQEAFDNQLGELLKAHAGEFVLFHGGKPHQFYKTHSEAYTAGIETFGLDEAFLVSEVVQRSPQSVSLAWDLGIMFGR